MGVRFDRVSAFIDYLTVQERSEIAAMGLGNIRGPLAEELMPLIRQDFDHQRDMIKRRIRENREKFEDDTHASQLAGVDPDGDPISIAD